MNVSAVSMDIPRHSRASLSPEDANITRLALRMCLGVSDRKLIERWRLTGFLRSLTHPLAPTDRKDHRWHQRRLPCLTTILKGDPKRFLRQSYIIPLPSQYRHHFHPLPLFDPPRGLPVVRPLLLNENFARGIRHPPISNDCLPRYMMGSFLNYGSSMKSQLHQAVRLVTTEICAL